VLLENLDPVVLSVADIDQAILRHCRTAHGAELFRCRGTRIVRAETGIIGFFAVCAPVPFVGAGGSVEYDYPVIAEAVGHVDLIGRRIDSDTGGPVEPRLALAALDLARASDLQQELAGAREFEHVSILRAWSSFRRRACRSSSGRLGLAGGRDPHVPLVIDRYS